MSSPFLAEIRITSFNFAPKGWALCNGALLPINQNQALFALIGTTYGGDGRVNFALPNLQGRVPFHMGANFTLGQNGGEASHTLTASEMPAHTHTVQASAAPADLAGATGNLWANGNASAYDAAPTGAMNPAAVLNAGGNQPHENRSPYLVLNFIIALQGIFPSTA